MILQTNRQISTSRNESFYDYNLNWLQKVENKKAEGKIKMNKREEEQNQEIKMAYTKNNSIL